MKEEIAEILKKALEKKKIELTKDKITEMIEIPPSVEMGDYSFPCFSLSKIFKDDPHQIALEIRGIIGNAGGDFEDILVSGPYINFVINRKKLAENLVNEILTKKENFGKTDLGNGKKILVEFSSPNIAKPFGIGHLRSTIIGNSISNICRFEGFETIRMNYF